MPSIEFSVSCCQVFSKLFAILYVFCSCLLSSYHSHNQRFIFMLLAIFPFFFILSIRPFSIHIFLLSFISPTYLLLPKSLYDPILEYICKYHVGSISMFPAIFQSFTMLTISTTITIIK